MLIFISIIFLFNTQIKAQAAWDSLKIKLPKHYFKTVIILDSYRKADQEFKDTANRLASRLNMYAIKQFNASFYSPIFTKTSELNGITKNTHVLLTGNFMLLQPVFSGISQHSLIKAGMGLRWIFNSGKKGVWFVDASPFVTKDVTYESKGYFRLASTFVYSHNVSENFNWRVGVTKSFLWGNKNYWPFIGLRFGKLDKVNFSIQFPRSINLNVPRWHV
jgi:hypothetical protein